MSMDSASADWDAALERLPVLYCRALRMARSGLAPQAIALRLELPTEALAGVLALAEAKLAALQAQGQASLGAPRSGRVEGGQ